MPGAEHAIVEWSKVAEYLLSPMHDVGYKKAAFFARLGYHQSNPGELIDRLLDIARAGVLAETVVDDYGIKYVVDGLLPARGRMPVPLRTIWIVERARHHPRFITAYPV
jgi:hypothetical protein